jgi:hypothetical protein
VLVQTVLPQTPEAWAFVTLVFTTIAAGVGSIVKRWSDNRVSEANAEAKIAAEIAAVAADTAARLAAAQDRLIESAEKREVAATARMESALQGLAQLTHVVTELTNINKVTLEEVRRANTNFETVIRDRR